jgi:HlyD family secretion protein
MFRDGEEIFVPSFFVGVFVRWIAIILSVLSLAACGKTGAPTWQGYVEGEYVRVASPEAGSLQALRVERGETVAQGAPLFVLESGNEASLRREAAQRVLQADARLADLEKGRRREEIAAIEAQHARARAALDLARANLARQEKLMAAGFVSQAVLDEAQAAVDQAAAQAAELVAQLKVARLAARPDEIAAARAEAQAARAALAQAQWRLDQKAVAAPVAGAVQDRLYLPGEFVPAGSPVVVLLPPDNLKLRFFVGETDLAGIRPGQTVRASCDGCGAEIAATVRFVSTQAEYTPPVIYSRENRAKLVYMVEAGVTAKDASRLHVGQPIEVHRR